MLGGFWRSKSTARNDEIHQRPSFNRNLFSFNLQHGWVASLPIERATCSSGDELLQQMTEIHHLLKSTEPFIDNDLRQIAVQLRKLVATTLPQLMATAPPQLMTTLIAMKNPVEQFHDSIAMKFNRRATDVVSGSKSRFIFSDDHILDAIDHDPAYFDVPSKLSAACALVDTARDVAQNFTENIAKRYQQLKLAVIPNETYILAKLAQLADNLGAQTIDFDVAENDIRILTRKIQEENDHIGETSVGEIYIFSRDIDAMAIAVAEQMRKLVDGIYELIPESVIIHPHSTRTNQTKEPVFVVFIFFHVFFSGVWIVGAAMQFARALENEIVQLDPNLAVCLVRQTGCVRQNCR